MAIGDDSREALFPGSGEMARLMRVKDWSPTPVGDPARWPSSLRTAVRLMLTSRFSMWMAWGPELTFFYNDAYRQATLGQKHPGALGARSQDVWSEIWSEIGPRIQQVLDEGVATWDEALQLFLERSGFSEETYHTFSYSPIHDDDGVIRGMLCVVVEETERVIAERRLALLRDLAAALGSSATTRDVLAAVESCLTNDPRDLPFTLTYLVDEVGGTAHLSSMTGIAADHPAVRAVIDRRDPNPPWPLWEVGGATAVVAVDLASNPRGEAPGAMWPVGPWERPPTDALVLRISHPGHHERIAGLFVAALNPHRPVDGAYRDFVGLLVGQISAGLANARAHEHERHRAETLAEIDRAKTTFFSNISHEFRTPLTLMLGPLGDLVVDPELPAPITAELARIQRNGQRLLKLVNTMLDFSRIEAGRMQARYAPVDLSRLTADLASVFRSATDKAGLALIIDCPPLGEPVYVDRDMWEKIVLNLVSNAFKFTMDGEIAVSIGWVGLDVVLTVRDTGVGIPASELPRLFERFHRIEGSRGRSYEGTGIGLALVQELVKLHGGSITVESEIDRGTTVRVTLPPVTAHPLAEGSGPLSTSADPKRSVAFVEEALRWLPSFTPPSEAPAVEVPRILVADDNSDMREYVGGLLASRWAVEAVANGREALEAARRQRPDLVVTDVMMPELDGFGLLRAFRTDEALSDVPVLMLSARAGEGSRVEGLTAGASDYLVKPFSARELVARVETLLVQGRIRAAEDAQSRRMAAVFRHAPVAIALLRGPEHVFEIANPAYLEFVGGTPVAGRPILEALPELDRGGVVALLDEVRATGRPFIGKTHPVMLRRSPEGPAEERYFDFVYQPIRDATEPVDDIVIVAFEVTDLVRARSEAEVANRAKDEFLAMLGHELRNPLAPISTALEMMRLRGDDSGLRERATIERQVRHMVGLVDDLLDVSRIAQGKVRLAPRRIEIAGVVHRAVALVSDMFEQRRHTLEFDVPRGTLIVDADEGRLEQVFTNLLTNAAKYTPPNGKITVTGRSDANDVVIEVHDNGVGIAPEMLDQIFEPFAQSRQSLDRAQGGLGLGLAIVRNLVRLHGGSVTAASTGVGNGTTFTVRLPRSLVEHPPEAPGPDLSPTGQPSGIRVLVVDDNEDGAEMLVQLLEAMGYDARCAFDGPSALTLADTFQPDIAVLDLGLPVMDGFELARRIRGHEAHATMPLVALTGYGQETDRKRSAAAGFAAHLVKPVDIERLADTLRTLQQAIGR